MRNKDIKLYLGHNVPAFVGYNDLNIMLQLETASSKFIEGQPAVCYLLIGYSFFSSLFLRRCRHFHTDCHLSSVFLFHSELIVSPKYVFIGIFSEKDSGLADECN